MPYKTSQEASRKSVTLQWNGMQWKGQKPHGNGEERGRSQHADTRKSQWHLGDSTDTRTSDTRKTYKLRFLTTTLLLMTMMLTTTMMMMMMVVMMIW